MMVKRFMSVLFMTVYAVILTHDFIPHSHDSISCQIQDQQRDDLQHSHKCSFPFHQHNMDEAGVFLNNPDLELNFDFLSLSSQSLLNYPDLFSVPYGKNFIHLIPPIYKGPDPSSVSFRGPPLS